MLAFEQSPINIFINKNVLLYAPWLCKNHKIFKMTQLKEVCISHIICAPAKSGWSLMISLQHHAQNFIPIRNLSLGQTFNNLFFFLFIFFFSTSESLTYTLGNTCYTSCCTHAKIALKTWLEIVTFRLWKILVTHFAAHAKIALKT